MQLLFGIFLSCIAALPLLAQSAGEEGMQRLVEGNQRFINDTSEHPNRTTERRQETAELQEPFAVILGCADSRVSPEIIFDQGIGDLFIVRVAGNVAGPIEIASIEYAVFYLHARTILVLGHENCGAVHAVLDGKTRDIEPVASLIKPAVKKNRPLEECIKTNASLVAQQLKKNSALKKFIEKEGLLIQAGYYNFHTGQVELL
jgi:carbonic anhydrase